MRRRRTVAAPAAAIPAFAALSIAVLAATPAAAISVTDSRAGFEAANAALSFQSFESTPSGASIDYGDFTVTETGGTPFLVTHLENGLLGPAPLTHGKNYLWYDDNGDSVLTFVFDAPVIAFGADFTLSGGDAALQLEAAEETGSILAGIEPKFLGIWGFLAPTNTVSLTVDGAPDVAIDSLSYALAPVSGDVPLPAAAPLALAGLAALGFAARRRG